MKQRGEREGELGTGIECERMHKIDLCLFSLHNRFPCTTMFDSSSPGLQQ